jgi:predicted amidophosphoribosyltransferase
VKGELSEPQTAIEREEVRIDRRCWQWGLHLHGSVYPEHKTQVGKQLKRNVAILTYRQPGKDTVDIYKKL